MKQLNVAAIRRSSTWLAGSAGSAGGASQGAVQGRVRRSCSHLNGRTDTLHAVLCCAVLCCAVLCCAGHPGQEPARRCAMQTGRLGPGGACALLPPRRCSSGLLLSTACPPLPLSQHAAGEYFITGDLTPEVSSRRLPSHGPCTSAPGPPAAAGPLLPPDPPQPLACRAIPSWRCECHAVLRKRCRCLMTIACSGTPPTRRGGCLAT